MAQIVTDLSQRVPWRAGRATHNPFVISFLNGEVAYDITNLTFTLNIKRSGSILLELTEGSGLTKDAENGTLTVVLSEANLATLRGDLYDYELLYEIDGNTYAMFRDNLYIQEKNTANASTDVDVTVNLGDQVVEVSVETPPGESNDIDGGSAASIYLEDQNIDGGDA